MAAAEAPEHADGRLSRPSAAAPDDVRRALDALQSNPHEGDRIAHRLLVGSSLSPLARATVLLGLGRHEQANGAVTSALIRYNEALQLVLDTTDPDVAADLEVEVRVSLASALQATGAPDEAFEQLRLAGPHARGAALGRLLTQRGYLHAVRGEREDALHDLDQGLPLLIAADDQPAVMRSLTVRGSLLMQRGSYEAALADYEDLARLAAQHEHRVLAAAAAHGFAFANGRIGRLPEALRGFRVARAEFDRLGEGRALGDLDIDECEVLLELGLGADAVPLARRVVEAARLGGNVAQLAEALLMLARAALMADASAVALDAADESARLFAADGRNAWAALARYWTVVAADTTAADTTAADTAAGATAAGPARPALLRQFVRLRKIADELERCGWTSEAAELRVRTGRLAVEAGRPDVAAGVLGQASAAQRHPLARVRAEAWHAVALLHVAERDLAAARRALRAGLRSVEQHRASLGAVELRSGAGRLGAPLAAVGLKLAVESGRAASVLEWAERGRGGAMGAPAPRGAAAPEELMTQLRAARRALADATAVDVDHAVEAELRARAARLETEVTRSIRQHSGDGQEHSAFGAAQLRRALRDTTLVEYVDSGGQLFAVVCTAERVRLARLGPTAAVSAINDHLVFAVRRLAAMASGPAAQRAWAGFAAARSELQAALIDPLARSLGDGPLVVVPTGPLHDVLWGALPAAERPHGLSVAPSAAWWAHPPAPRRELAVLLVAGPELGHAEVEVRRVAALYPHAAALTAADATVEAVLREMSAATLVHIAAHGVFRTDNPLFSTLQLHDGPLFVHELEALPQVPDAVILAACSSGRSGVLPGDELLGTAAVLMGLGVRTVIAPMLPVADMVTADLAVALHDGLRRELAPAAAIAAVLRGAVEARRLDLVAAAASFSCLSGRRS